MFNWTAYFMYFIDYRYQSLSTPPHDYLIKLFEAPLKKVDRTKIWEEWADVPLIISTLNTNSFFKFFIKSFNMQYFIDNLFNLSLFDYYNNFTFKIWFSHTVWLDSNFDYFSEMKHVWKKLPSKSASAEMSVPHPRSWQKSWQIIWRKHLDNWRKAVLKMNPATLTRKIFRRQVKNRIKIKNNNNYRHQESRQKVNRFKDEDSQCGDSFGIWTKDFDITTQFQ